ncbi:hypothetical protein F2Q70_00033939 [Brassica cretica]|uniref:Glutamine amidotransferase type-2 domain-containing protein n=1 Tax=Brassica cretica TaxID=69181 RepID=A0A8S9JTZ1_BRACR|nr:hypothetical protein F2Q70_00033939 [Brassica cretica]
MAATSCFSSSISLNAKPYKPSKPLPFLRSPFLQPSSSPLPASLSSSHGVVSSSRIKNHPLAFLSDDYDEKPREECGVVGIYGDSEASRLCYLALHALQHRGQEGAGIVTVSKDKVLQTITGVGLVSEVFNESKLDQLPGDIAIGHCLMPHPEPKQCIFEHIYFSLPNSIVFGRSVYESRHVFGEILATESPVDCDVVIAVPDSGVVAALGYAAKSGVAFQQGLIRSHYVGRTFIEPSQKIRDFGVKLKLSPVRGVLEGKRVVVVDDSIVRGTTSSKIVRLLREAGAKEVHMRIASPPIVASCYYGVDTPSSEELISNRMSVDEVRNYIGSDSLAFLSFETLKKHLGEDSKTFCYACFTGNYPVKPTEDKVKRGGGDFIDDGLVGGINNIEGGWVR